ncbi:hypothetical protein TURU_126621 [Turdus rufiventris]|nr:hypothetical protein TURU_126621 [Turdus rufiventris]
MDVSMAPRVKLIPQEQHLPGFRDPLPSKPRHTIPQILPFLHETSGASKLCSLSTGCSWDVQFRMDFPGWILAGRASLILDFPGQILVGRASLILDFPGQIFIGRTSLILDFPGQIFVGRTSLILDFPEQIPAGGTSLILDFPGQIFVGRTSLILDFPEQIPAGRTSLILPQLHEEGELIPTSHSNSSLWLTSPGLFHAPSTTKAQLHLQTPSPSILSPDLCSQSLLPLLDNIETPNCTNQMGSTPVVIGRNFLLKPSINHGNWGGTSRL